MRRDSPNSSPSALVASVMPSVKSACNKAGARLKALSSDAVQAQNPAAFEGADVGGDILRFITNRKDRL